MQRQFLVALVLGIVWTVAPPAQADADTYAPLHEQHMGMTDQRWPLKLLPMMAQHQKAMMRGHLEAVQKIIAGLANNDFASVIAAARTLGYSEQTAKTCSMIGAATPGFTERALQFHLAADTIAAAAESKNTASVLSALNKTLDNCTGCHAKYRQEIVDPATWDKLPKQLKLQ